MSKTKHTEGILYLSHSPVRVTTMGNGFKGRPFKSVKNQKTIGGNIIFNGYGNSNEEAEANASRLVKCWNMFDKLVDALKAVDGYEERGASKGGPRIGTDIINQVREVLQEAKQQP